MKKFSERYKKFLKSRDLTSAEIRAIEKQKPFKRCPVCHSRKKPAYGNDGHEYGVYDGEGFVLDVRCDEYLWLYCKDCGARTVEVQSRIDYAIVKSLWNRGKVYPKVVINNE
jgi:5-methylcytosine-specific restriction endonuclease McrA